MRLIEGQNQVLERIVRGEPLKPTLDLLLRVIEAEFPGMLCSILLLDPDGTRIRHISAPSLPEGFTSAIDGEAIGPQAGSCGIAAYRNAPVVVEDIDTDPLWTDYRDLASRHGLRSCWSTPIVDEQNRVLGTFALYFRHPARPEARHWEVIELATHTAAIAIAKARSAEERRAAEAEGRRRQQQLEQLPALMLLDLQLPKVDGIDVLRHARAHAVWRKVPVVVLITSRERCDIDAAYRLGVNSYLIKPIDVHAFARVIGIIKTYWLLTNEPPFPHDDGR